MFVPIEHIKTDINYEFAFYALFERELPFLRTALHKCDIVMVLIHEIF